MRKLVFALSLAVAALVAAGCKKDEPTSMKFDPKGAYTSQGQGQYTRGATAGTAGATTTTKP